MVGAGQLGDESGSEKNSRPETDNFPHSIIG